MAKRFLILAVSLVVLVLAAEGGLSLFAGKSWKELFGRRTFLESLADPLIQTDADRFAAAASVPGPYRIHEDPRVAYVLKSDTELDVAGARVRTDELGLRARHGPAPSADAFRILVLGDSVAFGWGLQAEEVPAVRLEEALHAARGDGEVEIACFTVAVPSWNTTNAAQFVIDHLDQLDPDLVLYMHVPNDLNDCYGVYETGHRRRQPDLCSDDPMVHVSENMPYLRRAVQRLNDAGVPLDTVDIGPQILDAGLSPTSRLRLERMAATLARLQERLAAVGARLVLLPFRQHALHRQLRARLIATDVELAVIPLLDELLVEDSQRDDPHPSPETVRTMAIWTAESLIDAGLVPRSSKGALPSVPARFADRRAVELSDAEILDWSAAYELTAYAELVSVIDHETVRGMHQLYGGINLDGSMGPELLALLPPGGRLRVELGPFEPRPDLVPQAVRVEVGGELVGSIEVTAGGASSGTFSLPPAAQAPYEVRLVAGRYGVAPVFGASAVVSVRFVSLASLPE